MIVRISKSPLMPEHILEKQFENLTRRFKPALIKQPGLVAAFWVKSPDGRRGSITIWESEELMKAGGEAASATPLLPGQERRDLPGPGQEVQFLEVLEHHISGGA